MHNNVSYLRIRPCDSDNEIYLNSRLKEGTTTFFVKNHFNFEIIHKKGFQTISENKAYNSFMWKINDDNWKDFKDVDSKRLIYLYKGNKETALEIFTRLQPRIVEISKNIDSDFILSNGPKYQHLISKYVDTIEEAIKAAPVAVAAAPAAEAAASGGDEKKEAKAEPPSEKQEEAAMEGLSSLFG